MDFLPKTAHLQGENTRKNSKYTQFSKSRQTYGRQDPPYIITNKPNYHAHTFQSFLSKKLKSCSSYELSKTAHK